MILLGLSLFPLTNSTASEQEEQKEGKASFYSGKFHGRTTASGDIFNRYKVSAASNQFPLGTILNIWRVKDKDTLKIKVKVNDRMAEHTGKLRTFDLSEKAMRELKGLKEGVINVNYEIL